MMDNRYDLMLLGLSFLANMKCECGKKRHNATSERKENLKEGGENQALVYDTKG